MQAQGSSLVPSRDGVLYVAAWAVEVRVHRGHLIVSARTGREVEEGRFARVARPQLRRLCISTKGGYVSMEALAWCRGAGVGLLLLDRSGRVLAETGEQAAGVPAIRRAQVA